MSKREVSPAQRLVMIMEQQLKGAEDAMLGRPCRVTKGMWKRGGKTKAGSPDDTHYEAAYRSWCRGRSRAYANERLTVHETRSPWCLRGYYCTLAVMDHVGGRTNDLHTAPARTSRPTPAPHLPSAPDEEFNEVVPTSAPTWFEPGHSVPYESPFLNHGPCTITVSADGERLLYESKRRRHGEPVFSENDGLKRPRELWAKHYVRRAQQAQGASTTTAEGASYLKLLAMSPSARTAAVKADPSLGSVLKAVEEEESRLDDVDDEVAS